MTYVDTGIAGPEGLASHRAMPKAAGIDGRLQFVFDFNERHYVWSYRLAVFNPTPYEIEIRGRRWDISWGPDREIAPPQTDTECLFAPSFAGGRPIVPPGSDFVFETAIVTESDDPPTMSGKLESYNRTTGAEGNINVPEFAFRRRRLKPVKPELSRLDKLNTAKICAAIAAYNGAVNEGGGALFRADRLDFTPPVQTLINCFLFAAFRSEMGKGRYVDFAPILHPDVKEPSKLETTDHYIDRTGGGDDESKGDLYFSYVIVYKYWEVFKQKSADAGLIETMADIRSKFGFAAIQELLRTASPEERALVAGTVAADFRAAATENEKPPELSAADRRAFVAHAKKHPWTGANSASPSAFIATTFDTWLKRGLSLKDVRTTQPKLAASYSTEVSRDPSKRLPDLYVKPHKLPIGAPPRLRPDRRVSELSEGQLRRIRQRDRERKSRQRTGEPKPD